MVSLGAVAGGVATVDIAPTVAEMLGITPPPPRDGQSRLALARTGDAGAKGE